MDRSTVVTFAHTTWPVAADHFGVGLVILGIACAVAWTIVKCVEKG